jgi:hypothetical protein
VGRGSTEAGRAASAQRNSAGGRSEAAARRQRTLRCKCAEGKGLLCRARGARAGAVSVRRDPELRRLSGCARLIEWFWTFNTNNKMQLQTSRAWLWPVENLDMRDSPTNSASISMGIVGDEVVNLVV